MIPGPIARQKDAGGSGSSRSATGGKYRLGSAATTAWAAREPCADVAACPATPGPCLAERAFFRAPLPAVAIGILPLLFARAPRPAAEAPPSKVVPGRLSPSDRCRPPRRASRR